MSRGVATQWCWGLGRVVVVSVAVLVVMASGVEASGCAVGSYDDGSGVCQACPTGSTTLGAGQGASIDDCVCQTSSYQKDIVSFDPATTAEQLVSGTAIALGNHPFQTGDLTLVAKYKLSNENRDDERPIISLTHSKPGNSKQEIELIIGSDNHFYFLILEDSATWTFLKNMFVDGVDDYTSTNTWYSVAARWDSSTNTASMWLQSSSSAGLWKSVHHSNGLFTSTGGRVDTGTFQVQLGGRTRSAHTLSDASIAGAYIFDGWLTDEQVASALDKIVVDAEDNMDQFTSFCTSCPPSSTTLGTGQGASIEDCVCQTGSFGLPQKQSLIYDFGTQDYSGAATDTDRVTLFRNYAKTIPGLIGETTFTHWNSNRNGGFAYYHATQSGTGNISFPLDTSFSKVTVLLSNEYSSAVSRIDVYVGKQAVLGDAESKRRTVRYADNVVTFEYFFEAGDWLSLVEPEDGTLGKDLSITFETTCQACPPSSTTLGAGQGASIDDCVCQTGSYKSPQLFPPVRAREADACFGNAIADIQTSKTATCTVSGEDYGNGDYTLKFSSAYSNVYSPHYLFDRDPGNAKSYDAAFKQDSYAADGTFDGSSSLNGISGEWISVSMPTSVKMTSIEMFTRDYSATHQERFPNAYTILGRNSDADSWTQIYTGAVGSAFTTSPRCKTATDNCVYVQDIATDLSFLQIAVVFTTKQASNHLTITFAELNIYGESSETCVGCGAGTTTLAANSTSPEDCVCESGSFTAAPRVAFNPSGGYKDFPGGASNYYPGNPNNNAVSGTDYVDLGTLDWRIASHGGFTAVGKFKDDDNTKSYTRVFEFSDNFLNAQTWGLMLLREGSSNNNWRTTVMRQISGTTYKCSIFKEFASTGTVNSFIMRYDAATKTLYTKFDSDAEESKDCTTEYTAFDTPDQLDLPYNFIAAPVWNDDYLVGSVYGVYAYDHFLTQAEAQAILDGIETSAVNTVGSTLENYCTYCRPGEPYTDPLQAATAEAQCEAVTGSCEVLDVQISKPASSSGNVTSGMVRFVSFESHLVAHYKFDSAADLLVDSSGNGHHLTNHGASFTDTAGEYEVGAGAVAMTAQYMSFPDTIQPYDIWNGNGITFSLWIKLSSSTTNYGKVLSFGIADPQADNLIELLRNDATNQLNFFVKVAGAPTVTTTTQNYIGGWHFISWSFSTTGHSHIRIDNDAEVIETSHTAFPQIDVGHNYIGAHNGGGNAMTGNIDDFRIYNRVLTADEVTKLYNKDPNPTQITLTFPASPTTTADVLVISHSFYRYVTNLVVSGQYTITVAAAAGEDSGFVGVNSPGVTSGGGIEYLVPRWVLGVAGETCDETCTPLNLQCDSAAQTAVDTETKMENILFTEFALTCVDGGAGRAYAGTPFVNADNNCYWWDGTHSYNTETSSLCNENEVSTHRALCRCVPATTGFENAITGTLETYTTPQVVVQYHAITCGDSGDSGPACTTIADPSVAPTVPPDVRDGLIAQYKFDELGGGEGVLDSSGNGKDLTAYNVRYENLAWKSRDSDTDVDYFEIDNEVYNPGYFSPQNFTISFWIKMNTNEFGTVASCRESPGFKGWIIYHNTGNKLSFWTGTSSKWDSVNIDSAFDGTWQHFVITLDGTSATNNLEIFRDKGLLRKNSFGYARAMANNMRIGEGGNEANVGTGWDPITSNSYLDEFRLYNRVLSQSEINTVYEHSSHLLPSAIAPAVVDPSVQSKFLTFDQLGTTTLQFPNATTGEVLVVSGTEFSHAQSIDLPAGSYTVTVGAGESKVVGGGGVEVAGSVGGTGYAEEMAYAGVPPASAWLGGRTDPESGAALNPNCNNTEYFGTESVHTLKEHIACVAGGTNGWLQLDLGEEAFVSGIITQGRVGTGEDQYVTKYVVKVTIDPDAETDSTSTSPAWNDAICETVDVSGWCTGNTDRTTKVTNYFSSNLKARYVRLYVKAFVGYASLRISVLTKYFNNLITGTPTAYATPQVILRYNTTVCSDTPTTTPAPTPPPFENTHNVTFLLAKGNVSHSAITSFRQTSIRTAIAGNLTGGDATRVHIAEVKDSPRRPGQEANMVILVEADDSASSGASDKVDFIAGKADWVAAQVRGVLDAEGLNVCGCNAASLVNSEIQTSINC